MAARSAARTRSILQEKRARRRVRAVRCALPCTRVLQQRQEAPARANKEEEGRDSA
jgi:hypothetical protein